MSAKPRVAIHKFASCSGCQLAFVNMGAELIELTKLVDIAHMAEVGHVLSEDEDMDIAFVEGSITTPHDVERLKKIREHSRFLITMGACATSGGIQALRNNADTAEWMRSVYAKPEFIHSLSSSGAIANYVKVDFELWGCPVSVRQMLAAVRAFLFGVTPPNLREKVCQECKRRGNNCILVTQGAACMGPVTRTGCGALCPSFGAPCYTCYGPAENINVGSFGRRLMGLGLSQEQVLRKFASINNAAPAFSDAAKLFCSEPWMEE
ncbi:NADH-quinone oxidoreductase subunit B family protein [Uliginosibacterium aquaticum]|uniref:Sulfhydrogenase subunit delta n=1 Tax=Uliginosibacterium aquaticum TaxID=2731212 RepID=A0ABX2IRU0_9RHOO|nr:sulfhydrogenase subunit delta [Uliginosibacterium aquaticum]NSL56710.1 sulfhydrogenase subunit delta [Uliginosibacterium aquaticum]